VADLCVFWSEDPTLPLLGAPCGEETACLIRSGCVHEHVLEWRACSGCALAEQQSTGEEGRIWCGRCSMTGPAPHECAPLVVIVWDEGYDVPEPVTIVQRPSMGDAALDPFERSEVIKTARDEDLYVAWCHSVEEPRWIGSRAHALAAGCEEDRLRRADRTGSSYMPGALSAPTCWDRDGLIAEQRGHLARADLAAYVLACADDRLADAHQMLKPLDWGESLHG
jgi:hypothetical protein